MSIAAVSPNDSAPTKEEGKTENKGTFYTNEVMVCKNLWPDFVISVFCLNSSARHEKISRIYMTTLAADLSLVSNNMKSLDTPGPRAYPDTISKKNH